MEWHAKQHCHNSLGNGDEGRGDLEHVTLSLGGGGRSSSTFQRQWDEMPYRSSECLVTTCQGTLAAVIWQQQ